MCSVLGNSPLQVSLTSIHFLLSCELTWFVFLDFFRVGVTDNVLHVNACKGHDYAYQQWMWCNTFLSSLFLNMDSYNEKRSIFTCITDLIWKKYDWWCVYRYKNNNQWITVEDKACLYVHACVWMCLRTNFVNTYDSWSIFSETAWCVTQFDKIKQ